MTNTNVFADFIHCDNAMFKHAKGMRDIYGLEFHPFYEIFLFLEGDAEFISGSFRTELKRNSLVIIPKESFHHFVVKCPEEEYRRYVINFSPFGNLHDLINEKMSEVCVLSATDCQLDRFKRLEEYSKSGDRYKKELVLQAALTDILLDIKPAESRDEFTNTPSINPLIKKAVEYININASRISRIDQIAAAVNISPSHFTHLFSKELHISPSKYLLEKKLVMANRMIDSGVGAVLAAERCGFESYSGFYKMYKRAFGISPSKTKQRKPT